MMRNNSLTQMKMIKGYQQTLTQRRGLGHNYLIPLILTKEEELIIKVTV
jgi:hypothetical protein